MSKELLTQSMSLIDNAVQILKAGGATVDQVISILEQSLGNLDKCYTAYPDSVSGPATLPQAGMMLRPATGSTVAAAAASSGDNSGPGGSPSWLFNPYVMAREIYVQAQGSNNPHISDQNAAFERATSFLEQMREVQQAVAVGRDPRSVSGPNPGRR